MNQVLFITETYLKETTPIADTVDTKDFKSHIFTAQDIYMQQLLGTKLYDELIASTIANGLTSDQIVLIDMCKPVIAYYTLYEAYLTQHAKFTSKGIVNKHGEQSSNVDLKTIQFISQSAKSKAEFYSQRILDFLRIPVNYTKYLSFHDAIYPILPNRESNSYDSGLYFGQRKIYNPYP